MRADHSLSRWRRTALVAAAVLLAPGASVPQEEAGPPVLLELFTSQGCSSCPPADRLVSRIGKLGELAGVSVIPLAFHVDYWDRLGWKDRYSRAAWSARQRRYGQVFGGDSVYTPQIVVDGRAHAVGSDLRHLTELVRAASAEGRRASVRLQLAEAKANRLRITAEPTIDGEAPGERLALRVAIYESGLVTDVRSGENAHRTLNDDYVVRELLELPPGERELLVPIDPEWNRSRLGVVAFLQNAESLAILAVERQAL